jgi:hypothetical protein
MARVILGSVAPSMQGSTLTLLAPTVDGDAVPPGTALLVQNTTGSAVNVTIVTGGTVGGSLAVDDIVVSIPANTMKVLGPFTEPYLPQSSSGRVDVNYATPASFLRAAIAVG